MFDKPIINKICNGNKNRSVAIALLLVLTIAIPLVALPALPTADAQATTRKTYPFIGATPNPVGVGQEVLLHIGITMALNTASMGWEDLSVTITDPDGANETLTGIRTDSTGGTGRVYVPHKTGNYTLQTHFPEQVTTSSKVATGTPNGTTMLASDSEILTLVVQEEPVPYYPGNPLPDEYWARPINSQLREWATISGNWLTNLGFMEVRGVRNNDDAPETGHILWTHQVEMGGLAGGDIQGIAGGPVGFETGAAYENKVPTKIIIDGILYYTKFASRGQPYSGNNEVTAIDLHTGEELWSKPLIGRTGKTTGATVAAADKMIDGAGAQFPDGIGQALSRGQLFYWESYNYMGAYGILWTVNGSTWMAFDALNGRWIYTITDVPSGTTIDGPNGEIYRYTVNTAQGWMALWNMSALVSMAGSWNPHGNVYNASGVTSTGALADGPARAWAWNITIPKGLPGSAQAVILGDRVFGASVSNTAVNSWAFSLKPGSEGALLFNTTWKAPADWVAGNVTTIFVPTCVSLKDNVFVVSIKETRQHYGFSATTGQLIWGPTEPQNYMDTYAERPINIIDGRIYSGQVSGIVYCYNATTGNLLWTYALADPYNQGGDHLGQNWPRRGDGFVVDGKLYTGYAEHSPNQPLPRDGPFICLDIETGELVWSLNMMASSFHLTALIGDSIIPMFNSYDNRFYAVGKGPSATSVSASLHGTSVMVEGMVTDVSPGTKDSALAMRFPHGVPAVADVNMSDWMQYVYMQFPQPSDVKGVEVTIDVLDANGNYRNIGNTTSDSSGFYSFAWQPDISGKYTIYATFVGSNSYYGSSAETAFYSSEATTPSPTQPPQTGLATTSDLLAYMAVGVIAIIIAVAIATVLLLRKRP